VPSHPRVLVRMYSRAEIRSVRRVAVIPERNRYHIAGLLRRAFAAPRACAADARKSKAGCRAQGEKNAVETFVKPRVYAGARTLEARWYLAPDVFAQERERLFTPGWSCVGREEQLAAPGDYFVADVAGESLIVTRDARGALRAFFNVCRHRGTRLCTVAGGHFAGPIQCPYHAWTYALDGTLQTARNMQNVPNFERADYPLIAASVATYGGFLFVSPASDPESSERMYSALRVRFGAWNLSGLRVARTIEYDLACNWKLIFQNYSECYHCPLVHPQLDRLSPSDSGRNDLDEGPILGGYSEMRANGVSLTTTGHSTRPPLGTVGGADLQRVYYYTVFPGLLLSLHPDYVMVHFVKPLAPNRTAVTCHWLFDPQTMATPGFDPSDAVDFWDVTNRQDWHVNELTQQGIESRAYRSGPYANQEGLLAAFDRYYLERMGA
jgi:Rieske 2Fe-2S family protein